MIRRLATRLQTADPLFALECFLAVYTACWGVQLLLPWQPPTFVAAPAFHGLAALGLPEDVWGAVACGLSAGRAWALRTGRPVWRARFSLVAAALWGTVATSAAWYNPSGTATSTYPWIALTCLGIYILHRRAGA